MMLSINSLISWGKGHYVTAYVIMRNHVHVLIGIRNIHSEGFWFAI